VELTYYTDYALRVLVYAGLRPERLCLISEVAEGYGISENHLMKVVHGLAQGGFLRTYRGKGGGFTLAKDPKDITIGMVVRHMEGPFKPVECFRTGNKCAITGACDLPAMLDEAFQAFITVLDRYTLADILERRSHLGRRLFGPTRGGVSGTRRIAPQTSSA
jgi:Rrf2 family transcriptional regulator, nitric oxide-sensitive transcriptional repressor